MVYLIIALSVALAIGALYIAAIAWLYFRQERLLFEPETLPADQPTFTDPDVHESFVEVPGARLSVAQLRLPNPRGVLFFLHGNSGNLKKWFVDLDAFRSLNFDVVMFDYRGFGKSSGHIESEAQLHQDVRAVWAEVGPRYRGRRVVISGQSLGTGLAGSLSAQLCAAGEAPDLTMMVSAYSSMKALAAELYPWVPSRVLRYPLATLEHACRLTGQLMLIHGDKDELIGFHHSERLHLAMPQAQLLCVKGAGHSDLNEFPSFRQAVAAALGRL